MASDAFTGADDTLLATHDAAWGSVNATYTVANFEVWGNTCRTTGTFSTAGARRTDSTADTSEAVLPAQTTTDTALIRAVAVRLDGTTRGYAIRFRTASAGNWTLASLAKNGSFVADFGSGSWAMNAAHTLKIVAQQSGSNVILHGYVDGVEIGTGITDSTSPYASGLNPGFWIAGNGTIANNTFDDWTDGASAGPSASLSESATASDSVGLSRAVDLTFTEAATASDAVALARSLWVSLSETATASDAFALAVGTGTGFSATLAETVTCSDAFALARSFGLSLTESTTPTDSLRGSFTPDAEPRVPPVVPQWWRRHAKGGRLWRW